MSALRNSRGRHIVTTEYEHDATLNIIKKYEKKAGKVAYIKPEDGKIEAEEHPECGFIQASTTLVKRDACK